MSVNSVFEIKHWANLYFFEELFTKIIYLHQNYIIGANIFALICRTLDGFVKIYY